MLKPKKIVRHPMLDVQRQQDNHPMASNSNNLATLANRHDTVSARGSMLVADITHQEPGFMPGRFEGLARWDVLKLLGNGIWLNALPSRRVPSSFLVV